MARPRFLVPLLKPAGTISLPEEESHHASRVLRCQTGDVVVLFDGKGNEATASIEAVSKRSVEAAIQTYDFAPRDHLGRLNFAVAVPKGDRQKSTVEKLVELGVDSLTPLATTRGVAVVDESNVDRLARYTIEACKQCGRNRLMTVGTSLTLNQLNIAQPHLQTWILHPDLPGTECYSIREACQLEMTYPPQQLLFLVGPEGGFTDDEVTLAVSLGAKILTLGDRIQRVETAVSTAAVLGSLWLSGS